MPCVFCGEGGGCQTGAACFVLGLTALSWPWFLPFLVSLTLKAGTSLMDLHAGTMKQLLSGERAALRLLLSQSLYHSDGACAGNAASFSKPLHLGQTHLPLKKHVGQSRTLILHPSHWYSQLDTCPELRAWGVFHIPEPSGVSPMECSRAEV